MIPAHYTESKMSPVTQGVLSSGATKKFDQSELDHRPAPRRGRPAENAADAGLCGARPSAAQVLETVSVGLAPGDLGSNERVRERERRGLRRLTIDVSEDDILANAPRGDEDLVRTDQDLPEPGHSTMAPRTTWGLLFRR